MDVDKLENPDECCMQNQMMGVDKENCGSYKISSSASSIHSDEIKTSSK